MTEKRCDEVTLLCDWRHSRDDKSQESEYREKDPRQAGEWVHEAGAGENQAAPSSEPDQSGH